MLKAGKAKRIDRQPALRPGKNMKKLSKEQKREIAAIAAKRDRDIDFSDIPPVLDWIGAEAGKFYRPANHTQSSRPPRKN